MNMRYLILMLALLSACKSFAQDLQFSKWQFGERAGLNFTGAALPSNLALPNSVNFVPIEGCASIADTNGHLLFFTDGITVWQATGSTYAIINPNTPLMGNASSAQNAVIVPRPGVADRYYIFTIDGSTGSKKGLFYSEFDFSGGIGTIVFANTPLRALDSTNHLVNVDENYKNISEAITTTLASYPDYWVTAYVKTDASVNGTLCSYLVQSSGVNTAPASSSPGPGVVHNAKCLKISPNGQFIALGNNTHLFMSTFNAANGSIGGFSTSVSANGAYGIEFSPNSANVYFTPFVDGLNVIRKFAVTLSTPTITDIPVTDAFPNSGYDQASALQRAIDGRIYVAQYKHSNNISVISEPNNLNAPAFGDHTIFLGDKRSTYGLPQWVYTHPGQCVSIQNLTAPLFNVNAGSTDHRQASLTINASNIIDTGATAVYHAGNSVTLDVGFSSNYGSNSFIYIEGCSNLFGAATSPRAYTETQSVIENEKVFRIYPNPSTGTVTVESSSLLKYISVFSIDGKLVLYQSEVQPHLQSINLQGLSSGIYIIMAETDNGMQSGKIIKN